MSEVSNDPHPFSRLTPDFIMDALESLNYRCDARNLELNSYENRVYQIGIEDAEPVIGKFYRPNRWSDEEILEEHEFTRELQDEEISVVAPLVLESGSSLAHYKDFRFALYPRRGGRAPELDDLNCLEILGRFIGRIHSVGGRKKFIHRRHISIEEYGFQTRLFLLENNFIPNDLLPAYESVSIALLEDLEKSIASVPYKSIRLHGDCHMGNVLWRDDIPHFVDFDDARSGPAIQDLWMMLSGEPSEQSIQMSTILEGYMDFMEFDYAELRLIEPLRTLRMMYHAGWLAKRWDDPAFPRAFPFFNTERYWSDHILELREQWAKLSEPSLQIFP
ncbi:MAG: serine/threonine protein kinase [Pseudomonadales bacterium]